MNKKINEQFKGIKDIYMLQCICTEQDDEIEKLQDRINKAIEYINSHYDLATDENVEFCILRDRVLGILEGKR